MNNQPLFTVATLVAVASALLSVLAVFGLAITSAQTEAVLGLVTVIAPFVIAWIAHRHVTPVANPKDNNGSPLIPESDAGVDYEPVDTELVDNAETTAEV